MQKKITQRGFILLGLCLTALLLTACSGGLEKQLREKAESYLSGLAAKTGVADTFSLKAEKADVSGKTDPICFHAHSAKYDKDFALYVSRDGGTVSDSYYTLSMQDQAEKEVAALLKEALGETPFSANISWTSAGLQTLSGRTFGSLKEFCEAAGSLGPLVIGISSGDKTQLTQEQIDLLLLAMQEKGIRATFYPYASDSVWYEVTNFGIWKTVRSGADGGAYLSRDEYKPGK